MTKARTRAKRKSKSAVVKPAAPKDVVQEALQVTWLLKGNLKNAQLAYLRVGTLLAQVRDKQLYAALGHKDLEDYGAKRLSLGRSSLYNYLRIHDWVSQCHPEWLKPKVKGAIPDLSDVGDLMWIENALARTDLAPDRRAILEKLHEEALAGTLRQSELRAYRAAGKPAKDQLAALLSALRGLRKKAAGIADVPPEALADLDGAIALVSHDKALKSAGLGVLTSPPGRWNAGLVA